MEGQPRPASLWAMVFKNFAWLEAHCGKACPVLVGHSLYDFDEGHEVDVYLILLSMDWTKTLHLQLDPGHRQIFEYLQPHDFYPRKNEIRLHGTSITVNISDPITRGDHVVVSDMGKVVSGEDETSAALYFSGPQDVERLSVPVSYESSPARNEYRINLKRCQHTSPLLTTIPSRLESRSLPAADEESRLWGPSLEEEYCLAAHFYT